MLNYFDNVYIINLPARTDRKMEMEAQFAKIGVPIDGKRVRFFPAIRPEGPAGFPSLGARGCFLSHLAALTHARDVGAGTTLLIEDDCNFVNNFSNRMALLQDSLPRSSWAFFYGGTLNAIDPSNIQDGWLAPSTGVMGSHFFGVNGAVLAELVAYLEAMLKRPPGDPEGGPMHVDGAYSWFRAAHTQYATYVSVPELAYQRASATDIHQRKWYAELKLLKFPIGLYRQFKNLVSSHTK